MIKTICTLTLVTAFMVPAFAQGTIPAPTNTVIKKTDKNVCHAPTGRYYARIKHFQSYKTMDECVKSGGKMFAKASPIVKAS